MIELMGRFMGKGFFLSILFFLISIPLQASYLSDDHHFFRDGFHDGDKMVSPRPILLAQNDVDDSYDPFTDYSEFDDPSEEEADINFFKHGRFFTIGLFAGSRGYTDNLRKLYSAAPTFGLYLSYFFDFRFALQFGFSTGDHDFALKVNDQSVTTTGNVAMTFITFSLKYYLNTQNVTRGLADLNPYLLGGVSQIYRTYTIVGQDSYSRDSSFSPHAGVGLELPLFRRKSFIGIQATYNLLNFKDKNSNLYLIDPVSGQSTETSAKPSGDSYDVIGILGFNF